MRPAPALASLHLAVALFGVAGLFGAWLAMSPVTIVLGRTVVAAVALAALALVTRTPARPVPGLAVNGAVLALHWVSFFAAIQAASVATGLLGYASFPLWTLVLERMSGARKGGPGDWAIAALVVAGLVLTVPGFDGRDASLRGLAWGVLSGMTFAWLAVRNRRYAQSHPARSIALWQNAFAALCLAPLVLFWPAAARWPTAHEAALVLVLGVACTALAHTLFVASLSTVSAHTASVVAALEPVYGIALAAWLLGERPAGGMLAGCALLVAAAVVASRGTGTAAGAGSR